MHKFIMWLFESLRNIEKFIRLSSLLIIMMLCLYWVMNSAGFSWRWMKPISPILDNILIFMNNIFSIPFDFGMRTFDKQYVSAVLVIAVIIGLLKFLNIIIDNLQLSYEETRLKYKKMVENSINNTLEQTVINEEKKLTRYMLSVKTRFAPRYKNKMKDGDLEEQNKFVNRFLSTELDTVPIVENNGFIFYINDFESVDKVIDIVYKLFDSPLPLEYSVCIQIENDRKKLRRLMALEEWKKIIISAETLHRYIHNTVHKYKTTNVGIFQQEDSTLEIHEIKRNL